MKRKTKKNPPTEINLEEFENWCDQHFAEIEDDTAEKAFFRFLEEQQGQEIDYVY